MNSFKHTSIIFFLIAAPIVIFLFAFTFAAHAQNPFDIEFPISELGNCGSIDECRAYCEESDHFNACGEWAAENGFAEDEALDVPPEGGPGGCLSEEECRAYCDSEDRVNECLDFAVSHGHLSATEAAQIREQQSRTGPGGCRSREECDAFCGTPENLKICIDFGVAEGHISAEEAERFLADAQRRISDDFGPGNVGPQVGRRGPTGPGEPRIDEAKAAQVLAELGGGPGGCADFRACDAYCSTPGNESVCFDFAIEHGLMDKAEAEKFKRLAVIEGPGGCKGRECEAYCEESGHERECLEFAHAQGFIGDDEFEEAHKFVKVIEEKGGPGGCKGRQCETFCNNPSNRDVCFEFAKSNNLLPPGELERIEKFKTLEKKVQEQGGPGGCRGERECHAYCSDTAHFDECAAFAVNEGFLSPDEAEHSLRQFIEVEQFGPSGRPGGFGPGGPQGFPGQGFGPGGEGGFPPGFENISPEERSKVEEQFKSRFEQFKQLRGEFEQGRIPQQGDFIQGQGFREGFHEGEGFQISDEQRAQFEREGHPAPLPGQFPGRGPGEGGEFPHEGPSGQGGFPPPGEFPGFRPGGEPIEPGQFPGREEFQHEGGFPPPSQFPGQEGFPPQFQGFQGETNVTPSGSFIPPDGSFPHPSEGSFTPPPTGSFEDHSGSFTQPDGGFTPPPGSFDGGTSGSFIPPPPTDSFFHPPEGSFTPPPPTGSFDSGSGSFAPPPGDFSQPPPPPPTSSLGILNLFANILSIFNPMFR